MVELNDSGFAAQQEAGYRRGVVLGLTVAEVFILLLFLLLIVFLALDNHWETLREVREKKLGELENTLSQWQDVIEEFKAPEEVVTLVRQKDKAQREAERFRRDAETLRELEAIGGDDAIGQARELQRAKEEMNEAQQETERLREELQVLRTKGQNPPCWYREVPDGSGGIREKPYYTFNVGVLEEHMIIRRLETPPGQAVNDGTSTYLEEAKRIGLDDIPYGVPLDDAGILRYLQPIHEAAKGKRVRSYSCIFWVRVWDNTSASAKKRWKKAHDDILEGLFGAYTVQDTPWQ